MRACVVQMTFYASQSHLGSYYMSFGSEGVITRFSRRKERVNTMTVNHLRHCDNGKEASILRIPRSHHEETRELPGERDSARNNARCTQARKTTHGLDGQRQDVDRTQ